MNVSYWISMSEVALLYFVLAVSTDIIHSYQDRQQFPVFRKVNALKERVNVRKNSHFHIVVIREKLMSEKTSAY